MHCGKPQGSTLCPTNLVHMQEQFIHFTRNIYCQLGKQCHHKMQGKAML